MARLLKIPSLQSRYWLSLCYPDNKTVENIGSFLYQIYVEECKWDFGKDNPSKLEVKLGQSNGRTPYLLDKYSQNSLWIIAENPNYPNGIVGCCRLISSTDAEIFGYANRSDSISKLRNQFGSKGVVETNRWAVHPHFRGGRITFELFSAVTHCYEQMSQNRPLIGAKPEISPLDVFKLTRGRYTGEKFGEPFYYEDQDPLPCQIEILRRISL